jgi:carboxypeptidase T
MPRGPARRLVPRIVVLVALMLAAPLAPGETASGTLPDGGSAFPPGDGGYHTYAEMVSVLDAAAAKHPTVVRKSSIGRSYRGREIWMVKISDNVSVDEDEPEVLFDGLHHGNEHMSAEMAISIVRLLSDGYRPGSRIKRLVDSREIYVVPMVNPDGGEFDISGRRYHSWRKNRQPNGQGQPKGTDVNRNYPYRWGCCGTHISRDPASRVYIGPSALSTPEARAIHDFVNRRVVGGAQQIRTAITFHTSGRLVMYPYGYTKRDVPSDMTRRDHRVFVAMARKMAASNGYRAIQASDLYTSSGSSRDWLYGRHRIFGFTFELTGGAYPRDETIRRETTRNHAAVLYLIARAACPYRAIGLAPRQCVAGSLVEAAVDDVRMTAR